MAQETVSGSWEFWIDRGGTFTDLVARSPRGELVTHKLLSENPNHYQDAAIQGIREILGLRRGEPIPAERIRAVKMGTTVATNALLEGRGAATVLVTTRGFGDALRIAYQQRPSIFALQIVKPKMLYSKVIEVEERLYADGRVLKALDLDRAERALRAAYAEGFRSAAILLMHGYKFHKHEAALALLAERIGFTQVSVSHKVSALIKFVGRGDTTLADAYLSPILQRYVARIAEQLGSTRLLFMQSNGGLVEARRFHGKDSILSGPAGGLIGAIKTCSNAGLHKLISFDMGGTSTDVAHYDGMLERSFDREIAGTRIRAPMMRIHTVAAGGGSVIYYDGLKYRVGPESAAADPGPACYGKGGPATVTDCNLVLGRLVPDYFPKVFGPDGRRPLDREAAEAALAALIDAEPPRTQGPPITEHEIAQGCLDIAVENIAQAIKKISVQRGYHLAEYTLSCFGGAGAQLACLVCDALAIRQIFIHPLAGVLSAFGMGLAELRTMAEETVEAPLTPTVLSQLTARLDRLKVVTSRRLAVQGVEHQRHEINLFLKYEGTDKALEIPHQGLEAMVAGFEEAHRSRFGFRGHNRIIIASLAVEAIEETPREPHERVDPELQPTTATPLQNQRMFLKGRFREVPVYGWDTAAPAGRIAGPAIIVNRHNTVVLEPGWEALMGRNLFLKRVHNDIAQPGFATSASDPPDPVLLEIFNNLFMSIAEQMGSTLENTSSSINMKERLDFSCAVFDRHGNLIANAPHMPVHLGSMGESVKALLKRESPRPGWAYACNDPYTGGTHLPDITVMTPVFSEPDRRLLFFVASRGHHADIGGITPGSMPPFSTHIDQEGTLLRNVAIVKDGVFQEQTIGDAFRKGPFPSRDVARNLGDLRAQIAANAKGERELAKMVQHHGEAGVTAYMSHVQDYAEACVRRVIDRLKPGSFTYPMDNGCRVVVRIDIDRDQRRVVIDFEGTSPQVSSNFNAPIAVCKAAVLYVFRSLVQENIPLNAGCLKPLLIRIPAGSLLNPDAPAAVVAGNVETSQVVTDALYGALGIMSAAQGTMNNLTFGNEHYQYYETICGGSGAGPDFHGTDAVHTHMTNSRITDPEILECRFPVLLEAFRIRPGSGGAGRYRGGMGVIRNIRFLEPMQVAILSNRRDVPPFGLAGGQPGLPGRNAIRRKDGTMQILKSADTVFVHSGDTVIIHTPGGGGYGPA